MGLPEYRDVGIGRLPTSKEIFVGRAGLCCVALEVISAGESQWRQGGKQRIDRDAFVVRVLVEFARRCTTLMERKKSLRAKISRVKQRSKFGLRARHSQLIGSGSFQNLDGLGGIVAT